MGIDAFSLRYQKSPIFFTGGIAQNMPGGGLPIVSITQAQNFDQGVLDSSSDLRLVDYLFDFYPMAGATLADFDVGTYPFANQAIAGNAIIANPLAISFRMEADVRRAGGYVEKLSVFQNLQSKIQQHASLGGTYTAATPSYVYTDLILRRLVDISAGEPGKPQNVWQWDFYKPLLTLADLQQAQQTYNLRTQQIASGVQVDKNTTKGDPNEGAISYSGLAPTVGAPSSLAAPGIVPAASGLQSSAVSGTPPSAPPGG